MAFGIGFVAGGVITGLATANRGAVLNAVHRLLSKVEISFQRKVASRVASFNSKIAGPSAKLPQ